MAVTHLPGEHAHPGAAGSGSPKELPAIPPIMAGDVAMGSSASWVLHGDALLSVAGQRERHRLSLQGLRLTSGTPRLAIDLDAHRLWIVVTDAATSQMVEFDERTLRELRDVSWPRLVRSAVAYRGHLYLQSEVGVADLAPDALQPVVLAGLSGTVGPIAADPARHRMIAISPGYPTNVWAFGPGGPTIESSEPLDIHGGSVSVVHGAIWVVGYSVSGRAVLLRLNPWSLQSARRGDARGFEPDAAIVGRGSRVLWVRTDRTAGRLACLSASTGRVEQEWQLPGVTSVASDSDGALAAMPDGDVLGLIMNGCVG